MNTFWMTAGGWWVQAAMSGGAVLLLGWLGMRLCRSPDLRQRIGAWAVRGAVLAAGLSALPQWVLLPKPEWMATPEPVVTATPEPVIAPPGEPDPEPPLPPSVVELPDADPDVAEWVWVPRATMPLDAPALTPEPTPLEEPTPSVKGAEASAHCRVPAANSADWSVVPLLLSAYVVAVGWFLLHLLRDAFALWWLVRRSAPLTGRARWVFDRLTDGQPRLRAVVSDRVRTPLCAGFFRPVLVLPRRMAERSDVTVLRWVLAHELCHLRRGDTRTAYWVAAARAVFFFVPWFWMVRKELSLYQEFLADAAASADTDGEAADYAAFLVDLSDGPNSRLSLAARMRAGKSDLFRRVQMLLNAKRDIAREAPRGFTVVAGVLALGAAVSLSGLGFAADPKKETSQPVEVEVVVIEEPGDVAKPVQVEVKAEELARVKQVKDEVVQLLKDGKVDEAKKLLEQLAAADVVKPRVVVREVPADVVKPAEVEVRVRDGKGVLQRVPAPPAKRLDRPTTEIMPRDNPQIVPLERMRLQPPADVVRQAPRVVIGNENDLRKQYEEQLKQFEKSIKDAADAEAREQLENARDEYKKAMEEPLKKADAARKELDVARKKLEDAEKANRFQNDDGLRRLIEKQKEMEQRLLKDFKRFELPLDPNDLKGMDELFKGLLDPRFGQGDVGGGLFVPVGRTLSQPRLGVRLDKVSPVLAEQLDLPKESGLVVTEVVAGSAAEKAGLKKNDVLLRLADKDVPTDPEAFTALVGKLKAGEKMDAVVIRKGKKETVMGIELPEARKSAGVGPANESIQVQLDDDNATLTATVDKTTYTIMGKVEGGKLVPAKITIGEGKEAKSYNSLDKVPEGQRDTVVRLVGRVRLVGGR